MGMMLTTFAAAESHAEKADILTSLGIDWTLLAMQAIAFLILVWALGKWVYPVFMRIIDERQTKIDESLEAARVAETHANSAQAEIDKKLAEARKEAKDIVATAKDEATAMVAKANEKSKATAEHMLASAQGEIAKEVLAAKKTLHNETLELVAQATEKVIGKVHSAKADKAVIASALKEAQ